MAASGATLLLTLTANADQAKREIGEVTEKTGGMSTAAKTAAVAAGAAVAGAVVKSVGAIADFDTGMREVFTLMPGISQQAMDAMSDDVREMAQEYGVVTSDVVPALYQSISAGVPPDNVMTFMETAAKTARGGVTNLETAVDGLSSVVNAYGTDVIDAARASDIMFTTVKLGKTDMSQLSASLFQVVPVASQLGVGFEEVGAALATMTAQGTPTRVAATQLRGALSELSKEGSVAFQNFEDATGQTFPEFVAAGGTVQDAMLALGEHAEAQDTPLTNMFGSIEGGMAAAALASESGAERMADAMGEMGSSAGATDEAFDTMSGGIGFQMDQMRAKIDELFLGLGEALMPAVSGVVDAAMPIVEALQPAFEALGEVIAALVPIIESVLGALQPLLDLVVVQLGNAAAGWQALGDGIDGTSQRWKDAVQAAVEETDEWAAAMEAAPGIIETLGGAVDFTTGIFDDATDAIDDNREATMRAKMEDYDARDAALELADSVEAVKNAEKELADQRRAAVDPLFALQQSSRDLAEAQSELTRLEAEGKVGTEEYDQAMRNLSDAVWAGDEAISSLDTESARGALEYLRSTGAITEDQMEYLISDMERYNRTQLKDKSASVTITTIKRSIFYSWSAQHGGEFPAGTVGLVGEAGPELVQFKTPVRVYSNEDTTRILNGRSGGSVRAGGGGVFVNVEGSVITETQLVTLIERALDNIGRFGGTSRVI